MNRSSALGFGVEAFGKATGPCGNAAALGLLGVAVGCRSTAENRAGAPGHGDSESDALSLSSLVIVVAVVRSRLHGHPLWVRFKGEANAAFAIAQFALATTHGLGSRLVRVVMRQDANAGFG
jgi:hypothetical protein